MAGGFSSNTWIVPRLIITVLCFKTAFCSWGRWGEWSEGSCTVTCGEGERMVTRTRFCNTPNQDCQGDNLDKKMVPCLAGTNCGDLMCYECNIFRSGKIVPCKEMQQLKSCKACAKFYTQIRLHDRVGYTRDSVVESRMCVRDDDFSQGQEEKCVFRRNNGGISIKCHCFTDGCNSGVRQGCSLASFLFIASAWIFKQCISNVYM